jgi:hypothetical protein
MNGPGFKFKARVQGGSSDPQINKQSQPLFTKFATRAGERLI